MFPRKAAVTPRSTWVVIPATSLTKSARRGNPEFDFHLTKAPSRTLHRLSRPEGRQPPEGASESALRIRQLPECHDPHPSSAPKLMATFHASAFRRQELRNVPRACERRQSCPDPGQRERTLRYLPRRSSQADRFRESAASRRSRRLHRLPHSTRQQVSRPAQDEPGGNLPQLSLRSGRDDGDEESPSSARFCSGMRHLPRAARQRQRKTAARNRTIPSAWSATAPTPGLAK